MAKTAPPPPKNSLQIARESEDAAAVRAAIMQLGYEKNDEIYPLLVEKLDDMNPSVQHAAVIALGRYGRADAIEELIKPKIFHSSNPQIRWAAVTAVGRLGDYRVIDLLLKAVEDPEWIVRTEAVTELMVKVRDIVARKDVRLARVLIYMFSLDNEEIVNLAMEGFQEMGPESLTWLHDALRNPSPNIRSNAARTLGKMKSRGSTPYLIDLLQDEDATVRTSACEALGRIGDKVSIEPLVSMVQDNVEKVQDQAVASLVGFGKQATIPLLNALSRERDKFAQRAFLKCLGRIGDPKSVAALISYLRSSYFIVRQSAVSALVRFGPIVTRHLVATLSFNASDIEKLTRDACDKEHPELQMRAIKALGGLEDHRAIPLLKEMVEEGLPDVQEAACQALYQIGCAAWGRCSALKVLGEVADPSAVPEILPSLQDESDNVRFEAVRALGKLAGPEAVKHLVRIARGDRADFIRREAFRVLRTAGLGQPGILDVAKGGLRDSSREVRVQAARLLGNFQDRKSILPLLKAMADPHWSVRESAETALLNFGQDAVDLLIEALNSRSWTTRFRAARLLGEIGDPRAVSPLKKALARRGERKSVRDVVDASLRKLENRATHL
ncbi:MAG: HEAT repeat domain-containing protein [Candidatus Aminicenantes bacterium]|nr:HEAT repeat domain-containing protein [Candidatus Aminicenantes bacterium]